MAEQDHVEAQLDRVLRARLVGLAPGTTLCPSEIARAVGAEDWRSLMEPTRRVARRLVVDGVAEITQHGEVVDPATARGPIRIRPAR